MKKLIFILGASGSGKTTLIKNIEIEKPDKYYFCYFDKPGAPSSEEVKEKYGGWEQWAIDRTNSWVKLAKENYLETRITLFDVHTHPINIENACKEFGITDYAVILLDCSDDERKKRLTERGQPHLINDSLLTWAQTLRDEAAIRKYIIIDNTNITKEECVREVEAKIGELIKFSS